MVGKFYYWALIAFAAIVLMGNDFILPHKKQEAQASAIIAATLAVAIRPREK